MRSKSTRTLLVLVAMFAMSAVAASSAWASGKPFVETWSATHGTETQATLRGVVNPEGAETKYHFEYGTTTSYGKSTTAVSVGSGTTELEELQKVTGLSPHATYDFRIVATNSNGTTDGSNKVFTTEGPKKPLAETGSATARTETSATLNGVVNPNEAETKYYFEYGTTESYGSKTAEMSAGSGTTNLNESTTITGLKAKTTYHFSIVATNAEGTTRGEDKTFYSEVGPEFNPNRKVTFIGTTGEIRAVWDGGEELSCEASTITGEITGATTVGDVVEKLTGCKNKTDLGTTCSIKSTTTTTAGEIVMYALKGELGTISTGTKVGLLLEPETGLEFTEIEKYSGCMPQSDLRGTLAGEVGSTGSEQTTNKLIYGTTGGEQSIREITLDSGTLLKPELTLYGSTFAMETEDSLTFSAAVEIT